MILETERLLLRPFTEADKAPYAAINADPEAMQYFDAPFSRERSDASVQRANDGLRANGFHFMATELKATKTFIGILGIAKINDQTRAVLRGAPEVEIGWRLDRSYWGKGLAPEGALACLEYGWDKLNLKEIVALTTTANTPSRRVMEKIGMHYDAHADFNHPELPDDCPVRPHVLYRIKNPNLL